MTKAKVGMFHEADGKASEAGKGQGNGFSSNPAEEACSPSDTLTLGLLTSQTVSFKLLSLW